MSNNGDKVYRNRIPRDFCVGVNQSLHIEQRNRPKLADTEVSCSL